MNPGADKVDSLIHEPARLRIVSILAVTEVADFNFLLGAAELSRGNLSTHMARLIGAGYATESKHFVGKIPHTEYALTETGRTAYRNYLAWWKNLTRA